MVKNLKYVLIGSFPPPYGGATIKNKILYDELSKYVNIKKINTHKISIITIMRIVKAFLFDKNNKMILSLSSYSLIKITKVFDLISRKRMKKVSVFIVGGRFPEILEEKKIDFSIYNLYSNIYVECEGMKEKLNKFGVTNVKVIPNFRKNYVLEKVENVIDEKEFKIIFMSRICLDKGVLIIIDACKFLNELGIKYRVDFYGPIDERISEKFYREINTVNNVYYKGIFDSIKEDVYRKLSKYDLLLLPTFHRGEGVPGILVESKIAGITSIVSNINYNYETIRHLENGILLENNNSEELANWIIELSKNKILLERLKNNSLKDSKRYLIENYIEEILK